MTVHAKSLGMLLMLVATVRGGGVLVLELDRPGPYEPASAVDVDVVLVNEDAVLREPRLVTLDFSVTDAALGLPATFSWNTSLATGLPMYAQFSAMPKVDLVYGGTSPIPGFIIELPPGGSVLVGALSVTMPDAPGTFMLDAINADAGKQIGGARVVFGFAAPDAWEPWNGTLTGGTLAMTVVPEPTTVLLLSLSGAGWMALRRRRRE